MTRRLVMVIDQERCIGCEACAVACRLENDSGGLWITVDTEGSELKDSPNGVHPDLDMVFRPRTCNHCDEPPCVDACPVQAIFKRDDGPVVLDSNQCDGCGACLEACPYRAIVRSRSGDKAGKCNWCVHRLDQGLEPFCVVCCEGQAIIFGDLNDEATGLADLISDRGAYRLLPEANTGPATYYCPPKPKRGP